MRSVLWVSLIAVAFVGGCEKAMEPESERATQRPETPAMLFVAADGPFATLERARDEIRRMKKAGGLPKGEVVVELRGGVYEMGRTFELTEEDSGAEGAPIIYRGRQGEEARLVGGRPVTNFAPVSDPAVLQRLDKGARGKVMQADLKALGIKEYGTFPNSYRGDKPILELFFNDRPMPLARWPNEGWTTIARTLAGGSRHREKEFKPGAFMYHGDRPQRWGQAEDVMLSGYWCHDWYWECLKVKAIDTQAHTMTFAGPSAYGIGGAKYRRYFAFNLLEEIDSPGEWYLDRKTGMLYFWPPSSPEKGKAWVSTLATPLVTMKGVSHVMLRRLTLEAAQGDGVVIEGGSDNRVAGCTARNLGANAVLLKEGTCNGVVGCDIYEVGRGGVVIEAGDRKTLTPAGDFADNNHIHHFGRLQRTGAGAVHLGGVGNRVTHNLIHHAPHTAVWFGGNDHLIEFNEMHHLMLETHDAGAIYMGRNWTVQGTVIRYNFIHHRGAYGIGSSGVYLDDGNAGTTIFGNVFYTGTWAVVLGGSRDCRVENNIFVDCKPAVNVDDRAYNHMGETGTLILTLKQVPYDRPPWSTRYPRLANILNDEPGEPKYNVVARNVRVGGEWTILNRRKEGKPPLEEIIEFKDNFIEGDPRFVDAKNLNFQLRDDSPVYKKIPGFQRIPFEKIGLYGDDLRATWPIAGFEATRKEPMKEDKVLLPPPIKVEKPAPFPAYRVAAPIILDGREGTDEWPKGGDRKPVSIEQTPNHGKVNPGTPASCARAAYDDDSLYVLLVNRVADEKNLAKGAEWGKNDGAEVCFKDPGGKGPIYVVYGFAGGQVESVTRAGASEEQAKQLANSGLKVAVTISDKCWTAEYRIPLRAIGITPKKGLPLQFNIGVRHRGSKRSEAGDEWLAWVGTEAQNWRVDRAGEMIFQ